MQCCIIWRVCCKSNSMHQIRGVRSVVTPIATGYREDLEPTGTTGMASVTLRELLGPSPLPGEALHVGDTSSS